MNGWLKALLIGSALSALMALGRLPWDMGAGLSPRDIVGGLLDYGFYPMAALILYGLYRIGKGMKSRQAQN
jgi:hypothetical protein